MSKADELRKQREEQARQRAGEVAKPTAAERRQAAEDALKEATAPKSEKPKKKSSWPKGRKVGK